MATGGGFLGGREGPRNTASVATDKLEILSGASADVTTDSAPMGKLDGAPIEKPGSGGTISDSPGYEAQNSPAEIVADTDTGTEGTGPEKRPGKKSSSGTAPAFETGTGTDRVLIAGGNSETENKDGVDENVEGDATTEDTTSPEGGEHEDGEAESIDTVGTGDVNKEAAAGAADKETLPWVKSDKGGAV